MADIATLGIRIDTGGTVGKATAELEKLDATGTKIEASAKRMGSAFSVATGRIANDTAATVPALRNMAGEAENLLSTMTVLRGAASAVLGGVIVQGALSASKALYEASASGERLRTTLQFATGNGAAEMAYLTDLTQRLGLRMDGTAQAYASFAAAARGTAIEGQKTRDIFEAISKASAVMGLTTEQSSGALLALQQMVSKGTVQAEELRGQLGERLPGAFQVAAKAMGVTTAELGKMLEQGQVLSDDFLPKFAAALNEHIGDAASNAGDRLDAATNRMATAWERLKRVTGDSGVTAALNREVQGITNDMTAMSDAIQRASDQGDSSLTALAKGAGVGAGRAAFGALNLAANALNGTINALTGGVLGLRTDLALLPDALKTSAGQAQILAQDLASAEARLQALKLQGADSSPNIYLRSAYFDAQRLVEKLADAKRGFDNLASGAGAGRGLVNPQTIGQMDAARQATLGSVSSYLSDNARQTKPQIRAEEIAKATEANAKLIASVNARLTGEERTNKLLELRKALETEVGNINQKYADKSTKAAENRAKHEAEQIAKAKLGSDIESIRTASEAVIASVSSRESVLEAMRAAGLVQESEYWEKKKALMLEGEKAREDAVVREIERLKQEKLAGADKITNDKKIAESEAKLSTLREKAAAEGEVLAIRQAASARALVVQYEQAEAAARAYVETIVRANTRDLDAMGRGSLARDKAGRQNQREDQFQGRVDQLDSQRRANQITQSQYDQYLAIERDALTKSLAADDQYWAQRMAKQADWRVGASEVLNDYLESSNNVAAQTASVWSRGISGMEDALVRFATTGKLSFKDLATSIAADLVRIQVRAQSSSILSSIFSWIGGGASAGGSGWSMPSYGSLYSGGGYTGPGGVNEPAGVVHKGEVVWSQADVSRAGGVGAVESMRLGRKGYDEGGIVGPSGSLASGARGASTVVNVHAPAGSTVEQSTRRGNAGQEIIDVFIKQAATEVAGQLAGNYGPVGQAMNTRKKLGM